MRGSVIPLSAVSLCPPLQRPFLSGSPTQLPLNQPRNHSHNWSHRRWHDLDLDERWESGNEAGPISAQAGRGPPCRL